MGAGKSLRKGMNRLGVPVGVTLLCVGCPTGFVVAYATGGDKAPTTEAPAPNRTESRASGSPTVAAIIKGVGKIASGVTVANAKGVQCGTVRQYGGVPISLTAKELDGLTTHVWNGTEYVGPLAIGDRVDQMPGRDKCPQNVFVPTDHLDGIDVKAIAVRKG